MTNKVQDISVTAIADTASETLPRCRQVLAAGDAANTAAATLSITLDETDRHRRRRRFVADQGLAFFLDLPAARLLRHGDALLLDDGRQVLVQSLPESLYEVRGRDPHHLLVLTWHMGNRHLPAQVMPDHIRIRHDHVIRDMLEQLGATVTEISAPFDPEGGAYDDGEHVHAHTHTHGDHAHTH